MLVDERYYLQIADETIDAADRITCAFLVEIERSKTSRHNHKFRNTFIR